MFRTPAAIHVEQPARVLPELLLELDERGEQDAAAVLLAAEVAAGHAVPIAGEGEHLGAVGAA